MPDPVEVAVEGALLSSAVDLATSLSLTIALPNIEFTPPAVSRTAKYLRATFMPAQSIPLGVSFSASNQHYGILQIDVFFGKGGGEMEGARIASSVIAWFAPGSVLTRDNFNVNILRTPYRGPLVKDDPLLTGGGTDAWMIIPVSIPYIAFAPNPA